MAITAEEEVVGLAAAVAVTEVVEADMMGMFLL